MPLLDARGQPLEEFKKPQPVAIPKINGTFGQWAGRDEVFISLPGGGVLQFDLSRLTMEDYRAMRQNYQLGSSLAVLSFIMHQIDWEIQCKDKKIKDLIETDLHAHWTPLIRALSQSFWAGYSPIAVNYENQVDGFTHLAKLKDLIPEECRVNWNKIEGWAPPGMVKPKLYEYDGFKQNGFLIPAENTLWYPLLMENGDHYGRKLLKNAFPSWFFSNLIHLFANRYFERFGEPLPVGRGRFGDDVDMGNGVMVSGKTAMENVVTGIRNRAVVVLPSDRDPVTKEYDYDIQYLESQMRGADFERYLSRLDEEMSLAVFTPILLFRTADVGSYNLGVAHLRIFQQMLNAISGDMQFYLQKYLVDRMKEINFPGNKTACTWEYRRQGNADILDYKEILVALIRAGKMGVDPIELGRIAGLKLHEVKQLIAPPPGPGAPPIPGKPTSGSPPIPPKPGIPPVQPKTKAARAVLDEAVARVVSEMLNGKVPAALGFRNRFVQALQRDGIVERDAFVIADDLYAKMNNIVQNVAPIVAPEELQTVLSKAVELELTE